jgi:hypothetical protein
MESTNSAEKAMMNVQSTRACLTVGMLLLSVAIISGCASDKPKVEAQPIKPKAQPVSLGQIKTELMESKAQIQATSEALAVLQKSSSADAQANYNKFTDEYLKLQAKADAVKSRAEDLKAKSAAYYELWNKQAEVENADLRRGAVQQKADAERVFNSVRSEMELARIAFGPYVTNLKDVGNYLRGNLTPASLQSVAELTNKGAAQAKEVNSHLDAIVMAVDKMAAATGEGAVPPPNGSAAGAAVPAAAGTGAASPK